MSQPDVKQIVEAVTREVLARLGQATVPAAPSQAPVKPAGRRPLVAANWKMNAAKGELPAYAAELAQAPLAAVETVVIPPGVLIASVRAALATGGAAAVALGAQDVHAAASGAHTGETSVGLVRSVGAAWAIVGHSERRAAGESDDDVKAKLKAVLGGGLGAILCVGETGRERKDRATFRILRGQLMAALAPTALTPPEPERLAVAYEPVWAIGTGVTATTEQIAEAVAFLRQLLGETYGFPRARQVRILYGGSVTADSAKEICAVPGVDGLLVGGASLDGRSFRRIVEAAAAQASAVARAAAEARR